MASSAAWVGSAAPSFGSLLWLKYVAATFRDLVFGVLYLMAKSNRESRAAFLLLIAVDFLQMMAFIVNTRFAGLWGGGSIAAGLSQLFSYVGIRYWIKGQEHLLTLANRISTALVLLAAILVAYVARCWKLDSFTMIWPLKLLRFLSSLLVGILFVPIVTTLCLVFALPLDKFLVDGICAALSLVLLLPMAFVTKLVYVDTNINSGKLSSRAHGRCDLLYILFKTLVIMLNEWMPSEAQNNWMLLVLLCGSGVVLGLRVWRLPFYNNTMNKFVNGLLSVTVLAVLLAGLAHYNRDRLQDHKEALGGTFLGLALPVFVSVWCLTGWVAKFNYRLPSEQPPSQQSLAAWLDSAQSRLERLWNRRARESEFEPDPIEVVEAVEAPSTSEKWLANFKFLSPYHVDLSVRFLISDRSIKALQVAEALLEAGCRQFPKSALVHVVKARFEANIANDTPLAIRTMDDIVEKMSVPFDLQHAIFIKVSEYQRGQQSTQAGAGAVNAINFIELQRNLTNAQQCHLSVLRNMQAFWSLLLEDQVRATELETTITNIMSGRRSANLSYVELLHKYPNSPQILRAFASFAEEVLMDPDLATEFCDKADACEERDMKRKTQLALEVDKQHTQRMTITYTASGIISSVSSELAAHLGYEEAALIGKPTSCVMPLDPRAEQTTHKKKSISFSEPNTPHAAPAKTSPRRGATTGLSSLRTSASPRGLGPFGSKGFAAAPRSNSTVDTEFEGIVVTSHNVILDVTFVFPPATSTFAETTVSVVINNKEPRPLLLLASRQSWKVLAASLALIGRIGVALNAGDQLNTVLGVNSSIPGDSFTCGSSSFSAVQSSDSGATLFACSDTVGATKMRVIVDSVSSSPTESVCSPTVQPSDFKLGSPARRLSPAHPPKRAQAGAGVGAAPPLASPAALAVTEEDPSEQRGSGDRRLTVGDSLDAFEDDPEELRRVLDLEADATPRALDTGPSLESAGESAGFDFEPRLPDSEATLGGDGEDSVDSTLGSGGVGGEHVSSSRASGEFGVAPSPGWKKNVPAPTSSPALPDKPLVDVLVDEPAAGGVADTPNQSSEFASDREGLSDTEDDLEKEYETNSQHSKSSKSSGTHASSIIRCNLQTAIKELSSGTKVSHSQKQLQRVIYAFLLIAFLTNTNMLMTVTLLTGSGSLQAVDSAGAIRTNVEQIRFDANVLAAIQRHRDQPLPAQFAEDDLPKYLNLWDLDALAPSGPVNNYEAFWAMSVGERLEITTKQRLVTNAQKSWDKYDLLLDHQSAGIVDLFFRTQNVTVLAVFEDEAQHVPMETRLEEFGYLFLYNSLQLANVSLADQSLKHDVHYNYIVDNTELLMDLMTSLISTKREEQQLQFTQSIIAVRTVLITLVVMMMSLAWFAFRTAVELLSKEKVWILSTFLDVPRTTAVNLFLKNHDAVMVRETNNNGVEGEVDESEDVERNMVVQMARARKNQRRSRKLLFDGGSSMRTQHAQYIIAVLAVIALGYVSDTFLTNEMANLVKAHDHVELAELLSYESRHVLHLASLVVSQCQLPSQGPTCDVRVEQAQLASMVANMSTTLNLIYHGGFMRGRIITSIVSTASTQRMLSFDNYCHLLSDGCTAAEQEIAQFGLSNVFSLYKENLLVLASAPPSELWTGNPNYVAAVGMERRLVALGAKHLLIMQEHMEGQVNGQSLQKVAALVSATVALLAFLYIIVLNPMLRKMLTAAASVKSMLGMIPLATLVTMPRAIFILTDDKTKSVTIDSQGRDSRRAAVSEEEENILNIEALVKENSSILARVLRFLLRFRANAFVKNHPFLCMFIFGVVTQMWWIPTMVTMGFDYITSSTTMTITMIFGSFVSCSTVTGGSVVVFPVMSVFLEVSPPVARDFSLCIQSVGMVAAAGFIFLSGISVDPFVIIVSVVPGAIGMVLGSAYLDGMEAELRQVVFASVWTGFACGFLAVLSQVNCSSDQRVPRTRSVFYTLSLVSVVGGAITALVGNGLDMFLFTVINLYYRVDEKVGIPTSVCVMAINTVFGVLIRQQLFGGLQPETYPYFLAAAPVACIFAPLGAHFVTTHSVMASRCLSVLAITAQLVTVSAAVLVGNASLLWVAVPVVIAAAVVFFLMGLGGVFRAQAKELLCVLETTIAKAKA